uniref:Uncharacterized protein n=1 Tax=Eubacterium plexicaudatum ASF492 TaxID=1235802 RepID=N2AEW7_9FIRM
MTKKKVLVLASVASMIDQFNMQNIRLFIQLGYEVHTESCRNYLRKHGSVRSGYSTGMFMKKRLQTLIGNEKNRNTHAVKCRKNTKRLRQWDMEDAQQLERVRSDKL